MIEWLRPWWLAALPAGLALLYWWWRARAGAGPWRRVVDAGLLPHVTGTTPARSARLAAALAVAVLALACVALAGPAWRAETAPLYRDTTARIVVLDLSPSMNAVDVVPSRLERARSAIVAILRESGGAQLGLVVFAADAFTVAPLISDAGALVHLLASLDTATVPRQGSRPDLGLEMAQRLLERAGSRAGDVILVGDSAGDARTIEAARALRNAGFPVSVLGVGAAHGGPVRAPNGAFVKAESGEVLVVRPELAALERVAAAGGGRFHWLAPESGAPRFERGREVWAQAPAAPERDSGVKRDDGALFALFALPFAALLFRRGWLLAVAFVALPLPHAYALDWKDLWQRADQQAAAEFAKGQFGEQPALEKLGPRSPWRAALLYRSGRFAEAAAAYAERDTADAHYNRGNALALAGRLEEAIAAYGAALERSPAMRDALFNRAIVREALARRPPQSGDAEPQAQRDTSPSRSTRRPDTGRGARGQGDAAGDSTRGAQRGAEQWEDRADPKPTQVEPGEAAQPGGDAAAAEIRRLEALLAEVPDDPGSLLANRFQQQLRIRGSWQHDTGARW